MPSREAHITSAIGVVLFVFAFIGFGIIFDYIEYIIIFIFGSILPDILEPAYGYNHRSFFHSVIFLKIISIALLLTIIVAFLKPFYFYISSLIAGYILHLLMDSQSKMGLPRVHRNE